jgi:hypothetical protein
MIGKGFLYVKEILSTGDFSHTPAGATIEDQRLWASACTGMTGVLIFYRSMNIDLFRTEIKPNVRV